MTRAESFTWFLFVTVTFKKLITNPKAVLMYRLTTWKDVMLFTFNRQTTFYTLVLAYMTTLITIPATIFIRLSLTAVSIATSHLSISTTRKLSKNLMTITAIISLIKFLPIIILTTMSTRVTHHTTMVINRHPVRPNKTGTPLSSRPSSVCTSSCTTKYMCSATFLRPISTIVTSITNLIFQKPFTYTTVEFKDRRPTTSFPISKDRLCL